MKELNHQIEERNFAPVYLFTGEEDYMIEFYTNRISKELFEGQDAMMNLDTFDHETKDIQGVLDSMETLPFFAPKRIVVLKHMGLFESKNKNKAEAILNQLKRTGETTVCIIIEAKVDKRSKLYKYVAKEGYVHEFGYLEERELIRFIARRLKRSGKKIGQSSATYFIQTVGYELNHVVKEIDKLIDYCMEEEVIEISDIQQVCTVHLESRIFALVDAIGMKNREEALRLYQDMMALREPETRILFMISRQLSLIYQAKILSEQRQTSQQMAKELKVPGFVANKLVQQSRHFTMDDLELALSSLVDAEYAFKSGGLELKTSIELLILQLTLVKGPVVRS